MAGALGHDECCLQRDDVLGGRVLKSDGPSHPPGGGFRSREAETMLRE
jgi:hypothetical protein